MKVPELSSEDRVAFDKYLKEFLYHSELKNAADKFHAAMSEAIKARKEYDALLKKKK